ncbi:helix-turn-helix transcriptional regulator [uncultured Rikenella sp.]|uniref:helix-turn-helix domain-containing protein n=1 Tax=uncultured Rikenella sp. TaxID=368003 RepID=UPI002627FE1A|nr:helix-turn-helix transcriptional regulator [uncultured Rikenella sp.]
MSKFRILELCKQKGITQKDLAEKIGMTPVGLAKAANGNPTVGTLEKIASALGVDVTELFAKQGDFVAFVRRHGETHTFGTEKALIEYADGLKGGTDSEAPAAPSIFDDPIFR